MEYTAFQIKSGSIYKSPKTTGHNESLEENKNLHRPLAEMASLPDDLKTYHLVNDFVGKFISSGTF